MADAASTPAAARVPVVTADGQHGTVDAADVDALVRSGGRALTRQEVAKETEDARYDKTSTLGKVVGGLTGAVLPPTLAAIREGGSQALTGGLGALATKGLASAMGGEDAGREYAHQVENLKEAHPVAHGIGEAAGFVGGALLGGAGGIARAVPGAAIGVAGNAAEGLAARGLAGLASRGALGRAAATAGELAARGATEGALYSAASSISEDTLGDREVVGDKLWAAVGLGALGGAVGGALIGGAGSLAKSGARAAYEAAGTGLARFASGAEKVAGELGAKAEGAADAAGAEASRAAGTPAQAVDAVHEMLGKAASTEAQKGKAYEFAADAVLRGNGLQSTAYVKRAARVGMTSRDLGEIMMRNGVFNAEEGALNAARHGTTEEILPKLVALQETLGTRIGEITEASGARISRKELDKAFTNALREYRGMAGFENVIDGVEKYRESLYRHLGFGEIKTTGFTPLIDAEAGLSARAGKLPSPIAISDIERRPIVMAGGGRADRIATEEIPSLVTTKGKARQKFDFDAGLKEELPEAQNAFRPSSAKNAPHDVGLTPGIEAEGVDGTRAVKIRADKAPVTDARVQDVLEQRKALDRLVYQEQKTLDPKGRVAALRSLRTELEGVIERELDAASGKVPGELRAEYKAVKRDFFGTSILKEAAEDGAARAAKARTLSPSDYLAGLGAVAGGHFLAGPVAAIGHKVVRERGSAAAAVLLYRMAEMGTITRAVKAIDEHIGRAAKGLLEPPARRALTDPTSKVPIRRQADDVMKRVAAIQADPAGFADRVSRATEGMNANAPQLAGHLTQRMTSAAAFLASKMPIQGDKDPFSPRQAPRISDSEASSFVKYARYADEPTRFFDEVSQGKITPEGVETARALMPKAFEELQARTLDVLADKMARGELLPFRQRERVGVLLGIAATPSQEPGHMAFLQAHVIGSEKANQNPGAPAGPSRPMRTTQQSSPLDRLEGK